MDIFNINEPEYPRSRHDPRTLIEDKRLVLADSDEVIDITEIGGEPRKLIINRKVGTSRYCPEKKE